MVFFFCWPRSSFIITSGFDLKTSRIQALELKALRISKLLVKSMRNPWSFLWFLKTYARSLYHSKWWKDMKTRFSFFSFFSFQNSIFLETGLPNLFLKFEMSGRCLFKELRDFSFQNPTKFLFLTKFDKNLRIYLEEFKNSKRSSFMSLENEQIILL